jgi:hypothetical protein
MIRRYLGKQVSGRWPPVPENAPRADAVADRYGEVVRSQHITQSDPGVFGASYVAQTSSVDGESAFLNQPADRSAIEYFQGLEPFRLPASLPRAMRNGLRNDPLVIDQHARIAAATGPAEAVATKQKLRNLLKSLEHKSRAS